MKHETFFADRRPDMVKSGSHTLRHSQRKSAAPVDRGSTLW